MKKKLYKKPEGGTIPTRQEIDDWNNLIKFYNSQLTTTNTDRTKLDRSAGNLSGDIWNQYATSNPNFKYEKDSYIKKMQTYYNDLYNNPITQGKVGHPPAQLSEVDGWIGQSTSQYYIPTYHNGVNDVKNHIRGDVNAIFNPYATDVREAYMIDQNTLMNTDTNSVVPDPAIAKGYIHYNKFGGAPSMSQFFNFGISPTTLFIANEGGVPPTDAPTYMNKTTDFVSWLRKRATDSLGNNFDQEMKKYGGIHIKPSKRGTFTAAAKEHGKSVQSFASQVLANKDNYSPAMVKKANFARNASKWNHQTGGEYFNDYNEQPIDPSMYTMAQDPRSYNMDLVRAQFGNQGDCSDEEKMDPTSPCYDPTFTPGYVTNYDGNQLSADQIYGESNQPSMTDPRMVPSAQAPRGNQNQMMQGNNPMFGTQNQGDALVAGLNFLTGIFNYDDMKGQEKQMMGQTHADKIFMKDRRQNKGKYTVNEGYFDPLSMVPTQFKGYNTTSPYGKYGGHSYQEGGEYYMSDEMIQKILDAGGSVEFLND